MTQQICKKCGINTKNTIEIFAYNKFNICYKCEIIFFDIVEGFFQPERSKREDSHKCEMRCSEHCGNTVRDK